jgi:hypothetical protein
VLATLVDHDESGRLRPLAAGAWTVSTEENTGAGPVDITVRAEDGSSLIAIEAKVLAASLQGGQLHRYYEALVQQDPAARTRIGVVLLGPGDAVGEHEIARVQELPLMRNRTADFAVRIGWRDLEDLALAGPPGTAMSTFVESGFREINRLIDDGAKIKWPRGGGRLLVFTLAKRVREALQDVFPQVQVGHPRGRQG